MDVVVRLEAITAAVEATEDAVAGDKDGDEEGDEGVLERLLSGPDFKRERLTIPPAIGLVYKEANILTGVTRRSCACDSITDDARRPPSGIP